MSYNTVSLIGSSIMNWAFSERKLHRDGKSAYKVSRGLLISLYLEGKLSYYVQKKPLEIAPYNSGAVTGCVLKKNVYLKIAVLKPVRWNFELLNCQMKFAVTGETGVTRISNS